MVTYTVIYFRRGYPSPGDCALRAPTPTAAATFMFRHVPGTYRIKIKGVTYSREKSKK